MSSVRWLLFPGAVLDCVVRATRRVDAWLQAAWSWRRPRHLFAGCLLIAWSAASTAAPFELRWPVPGEAEVVETSTRKDGVQSTLKYTLHIGHADVAGEFIVSVSLREMRVGDQVVPLFDAPYIDHLLQPAIRIDAEGQALGLEDEEAFREAYESMVDLMTASDDGAAPAEWLLGGAAFDHARLACFQRWGHWVGAVQGAPSESGSSTQEQYEAPSLFGALPSTTTTYFDGPSPDLPGNLRYRLVMRIVETDGESMVRGMIDAMESSGIEPKRRPEPGELKSMRLEREDRLQADVEPLTLRPLVIDFSSTVEVSGDSVQPQHSATSGRYVFRWKSREEEIAEVRRREALQYDPPESRDDLAVATRYAPRYPPAAIRYRLQGAVKLEVSVDPAGEVVEVSVVESSGHRILDDEAVRTVRAWRFHPALRDGEPVGSRIVVPIEFLLDDTEPAESQG